MHQTTRPGVIVAPLDPQPRWPAGYIVHCGASGGGSAGENHPILRSVGAAVLRTVSRTQAQGLGPNRNRGVPRGNSSTGGSVQLSGATGARRPRSVL